MLLIYYSFLPQCLVRNKSKKQKDKPLKERGGGRGNREALQKEFFSRKHVLPKQNSLVVMWRTPSRSENFRSRSIHGALNPLADICLTSNPIRSYLERRYIAMQICTKGEM